MMSSTNILMASADRVQFCIRNLALVCAVSVSCDPPAKLQCQLPAQVRRADIQSFYCMSFPCSMLI